MKRFVVFVTISILMIASGCSEESSPLLQDTSMVVIRAYVYANEPVYDIKITSTLPLGSEDESAPPINDALVTLIKNGKRYALEPSPGDSGYYHYSGNDLTVETGDRLKIEVDYFDKIASGETVVPEPPEEVSISNNEFIVPDFSNIGGGFIGFKDLLNSSLKVYWKNENASLYFVALENLESDTQPMAMTIGDRQIKLGGRFRRMSQPTSADSFLVRLMSLSYLGKHSAKVYRVNQEYVDLYSSRNQDSRDLNEPLTNIKNGLGIFSAFNSDSVLFYVRRN